MASRSKKDEIGPVLQEALNSYGPCIINCPVSKDDHVFPIIPPNGTSEDIIYCE